ncbi:hypothetical protein THAOC_08910 [Thalassiosira oceanica]|uniref:Uncharacterized protein n=1 Tax=Thalassiosira oceanica TaxID=159749 RepID=K0T8U9_THAOC|nr:hypothetical protein THAOC_08910 [Thalassiosira oceanica]|eukprot:EJK69796.1 hypothetical protein THAOC_08910 [Thalassiosira oceanica]
MGRAGRVVGEDGDAPGGEGAGEGGGVGRSCGAPFRRRGVVRGRQWGAEPPTRVSLVPVMETFGRKARGLLHTRFHEIPKLELTSGAAAGVAVSDTNW